MVLLQKYTMLLLIQLAFTGRLMHELMSILNILISSYMLYDIEPFILAL